MSTGVASVVSSHASALVCFGERTRCVGLFAETVSRADEEQTLPPLGVRPAQEVSFRSTFSPDLTRPLQPPCRRRGPTSWPGSHSPVSGVLTGATHGHPLLPRPTLAPQVLTASGEGAVSEVAGHGRARGAAGERGCGGSPLRSEEPRCPVRSPTY